MSYRIDVTERNGRAFIERMFNSRPFDKNNAESVTIIGVAISGGKALERDANQNEKWLELVDSYLLGVALQTKANLGTWEGVSEGGFLCLLDSVDALAFEGAYLGLALELGDVSEEAVLVINYDARNNVLVASLLYAGIEGLNQFQALKTWRGGE